MVAEFESDLIRLRTRESMKVAKAKGRLRGKQPKLNPRQEAHLVTLHRAVLGSDTIARDLRRELLLARSSRLSASALSPLGHRQAASAYESADRNPAASSLMSGASRVGDRGSLRTGGRRGVSPAFWPASRSS